MVDVRNLSQSDKAQLINSLRTHRVNTLTELRRIEKIFAALNQHDVTEPMTSAWAHYVNSNNFLNELRGLTRNYPFSSECLDEAKWLVIQDPASNRSWNYCWLVLVKIQTNQLITKHAHSLASRPTMWGNTTPSPANVRQLAREFINEWTWAISQMLRHWETPPTVTGQ
ncbi:hypothetical protein L228DRAFT_284725 [Xylona heveae TC161]|uniref:Uncharacterized protein n=1 Tax=Xylona heveae (strain CBS 132557 / TC161) TaxID=1328760 RepID=A0A165FBS1_XYLHT|nr:hypothetical protein L228DRAFT_284725 [Xylona heveae TC161]KZF20795.1 hypothetical protein L228DRAFT_284725 [Xylona heveae TC161]